MRSFVLSAFLLALQAVAYVARSPQGRIERTCDTPLPSDEVLKAHKRMRLQPRTTPRDSIEVTAYFHVVRSPEKENWVSRDMVAKQVCDVPRKFTSPCSSRIDSCLEPGLLASWDHFPCSQNRLYDQPGMGNGK